MVHVIYIRIQDFSPASNVIETLITRLPHPVQTKLKIISNLPNRYRSALGEILSRCSIQHCTGIKTADQAVGYGSNGKPYLVSHPTVFYNVSHSGEYIVCAVSDVNLGVDVERVRDYNPRVAERYFSKTEYADLIAFKGEKRRDYFFTLWTIKESYLKALGRGLTKSLSSFSVKRKNNQYFLSGESATSDYSVFNTTLPGSYQVSVCYMSHRHEVVLREFSLSDLMSFFEDN